MTPDSRPRPRKVLLLIALLFAFYGISGVHPAPAAAESALLPPAEDPFYVADRPLDGLEPGAKIKERIVELGYGGTTFPATATQILFRTTDQFGSPSAAVTTIIESPIPGPRRLISYHSPYDALGSQCNPSYALRGGSTGRGPQVDDITIATLLAQGYTVVVPDYEGLKLRWTMGRESAQAALDSIRAAEHHLGADVSTPVGLFGYSGGSIPTGFASDLAPQYAPELNIIGAAAGGVLVEPAHNLSYVNGSQQWAGVIPALMNVYNDTFGLDLAQFLSEQGVTDLRNTAGQCLIDFATKYPGLTDAQLLQPEYPSLLDIPSVVEAFNTNIMGSLGTPRNPIFLGIGNSDGIGDGIMVDADVAGLATQYCSEGVSTQFTTYQGQSHFDAYPLWAVDAQRFLNDRFNGVPSTYCTAIPTGNALTPVPLP